MPLYDLSDFFSLSRALNYNLSSTSSGRYYVLKYMTGNKGLSAAQKNVLMKALSFLINAYGDKRRRLGPPAVLHPLRATALFSRAMEYPRLIDLLTELFHDVFEDIYPFDLDNPQWRTIMAQEFQNTLGRTEEASGEEVFERLMHLSRRDEETYYAYIGRMVDHEALAEPLIRAKMADRLDNTLDMRIDLAESAEERDFFQEVFEIAFLNVSTESIREADHPPPPPLNGARRLYELYKNAVLLSLIRQKDIISSQRDFHLLFHAVAVAGWNEAKRIFSHIIFYHAKDAGDIRSVLLEAMEYCHSDRINRITQPEEDFRLDGLFATYFDHPSHEARDQKLAELYHDKSLMIQAAIAFVVIFQSFLHDPDYHIRGISKQGILPGPA